MLEDSKGNYWFTTVDYVCVFDGTKHRCFTEKDGLSNFGQVHEDSNGTVWVESGFNAYSYDGVRFTSHDLIPDTLSNQWSVSPNDLWFQKGIHRLGNSDGPPGVY